MVEKFVLWLCLISSVMSAAVGISVGPVANDLTPYVSIIKPGAAEYNDILSTIMPASAVSDLSPLLPYTIIVQNISAEPLRGINVVFDIQKADGTIRHESIAERDLNPNSQGVLRPGQYRLYLPSATLSGHVSRPGSSVNFGTLPPALQPRSIAAGLTTKGVVITVEGLIRANGTFLGNDRLGYFNRIQLRQAAKVWLANMLVSYDTAPAMQIEQLRIISQRGTRPVDPFNEDFYNLQLERDAQLVLKQTQAGRSDAARVYSARVLREILVVKQ